MPIATLNIYLDMVNGILVGGLNGQSFKWPALFYGDVFQVNLYPVFPISGSTQRVPSNNIVQYQGIQFAAGNGILGLNVGLGPVDGSYAPVFTSFAGGGGSVAPWVWTQDNSQSNIGFWAGLFSLNTAAIKTLMTTAPFPLQIQETLQFEVSDSSVVNGQPTVEYSALLTIYQPVISPVNAPVPSPTASSGGSAIILVSQNGLWEVILTAGNDGTLVVTPINV